MYSITGLVNHADNTEVFKRAMLEQQRGGANAGYENSKYLAVNQRIHIPAGVYYVRDTIMVTGYCEVDAEVGTVIIGESPFMDDKPIFQCGGVDNVIKGINFIGGKYQLLIHGTFLDSNGWTHLWGNPEAGGRFHVERCGFYDCKHSAITVGGLEVQNRTTTTTQIIVSGCEAQCLRLWTGSADFLTFEKGRFIFDRRNYKGDFERLGFVNTGTPVTFVDCLFGLRGDYDFPDTRAALVRTNWGVHFVRCGQGDGKSVLVRLTNPTSREDYIQVESDKDVEPFIIMDGCGFNGVSDLHWLHVHTKAPRKILSFASIPFRNRPGNGCLPWTKGIAFHDGVLPNPWLGNWLAENMGALEISNIDRAFTL